MPLSIDTPLALYSIPLVFAVGLQPAAQRISLLQAAGVTHDNTKPRETLSRATTSSGTPVPEPTLAKARRLSAAHANASENFPLFLAALFAGHVAGLENKAMNVYAAGYALLRIGYNVAYANGTTEGVAALRSACFWGASGWSLYVIVKAANVLRVRGGRV